MGNSDELCMHCQLKKEEERKANCKHCRLTKKLLKEYSNGITLNNIQTDPVDKIESLFTSKDSIKYSVGGKLRSGITGEEITLEKGDLDGN